MPYSEGAISSIVTQLEKIDYAIKLSGLNNDRLLLAGKQRIKEVILTREGTAVYNGAVEVLRGTNE
ncbi:MAG: hypothetical protein AAB941_00795 [Patescibacteria group bacterium]